MNNNLVSIVPITYSDTNLIVTWRNQPFVRENLFTQNLITEKQHLNWMRNYVDKELCYQFIIKVDDVPIGTTFIKNINHQLKEGEFGIFIGEEWALGKGFGSKSTMLILDYAFNILNLNVILLKVFEDNKQAINSYINAGFKIIHSDYSPIYDKTIITMSIKKAF